MQTEDIRSKTDEHIDFPKTELETVRTWAREQMKSGQVTPWEYFYCMKLNETLNQILYGHYWDPPTTSAEED